MAAKLTKPKLTRPKLVRPRKIVRRRRIRISAQALEKALEGITSITCAFCRGTGKDPFGLLSRLSTCQVCSGRGTVWVREPVTTCAFCEGTGIQPYTGSRLHCVACGGKGVVTAIEPSEVCPTCGGKGTYPRKPHPLPPFALACQTCNGQGIVPREE